MRRRGRPQCGQGAGLAAAGRLLLARRAVARDPEAQSALAFVLIFVAGTVLWLPLDWERLYLTALPALVLLQAYPIAAAVERWSARSADPGANGQSRR